MHDMPLIPKNACPSRAGDTEKQVSNMKETGQPHPLLTQAKMRFRLKGIKMKDFYIKKPIKILSLYENRQPVTSQRLPYFRNYK